MIFSLIATIKKTGKKNLESRFWISATVCRFCFKNDVKQFLIISSLGADKAAGISI
jgi:hypothetical protein